MRFIGTYDSKRVSGGALPNGDFAYTLSEASTTSAAVYNTSTGVLIRTLWQNLSETVGSKTKTWDGKNDAGTTQSAGSYTVRILHGAVVIEKIATIGNSSTAQYGPTKHSYLRGIQSMAIHNGYGYYGVGFVEASQPSHKINLSTPQQKTHVREIRDGDVDLQIEYVATDGTYVYWAGLDGYAYDNGGGTASLIDCAIFATKVSDDTEYSFTGSVDIDVNGALKTSVRMTYAANAYTKMMAILKNNTNQRPTGLAVRRDGGVHLFVSHSALNQIKVYNKTTGKFVRNLSFTTPKGMHIDTSGYLWICHSTSKVGKYSINSDGTLSPVALEITGFTKAMCVATIPDGTRVVIIDCGTSQQIKSFDTTSGASDWTIGEAGGYVTGTPEVTSNKFMFDHPYLGANQDWLFKPSIVFNSADGSFWVGDGGNMRVMKFNSSRVHIDTISSMRMNYNVSFDQNNPTRVTNEHLEYLIDAAGGWQLKYNWAGKLVPDYIPSGQLDFRDFLKNMSTLSNGKTYASINYISDGTKYPEFVEMDITYGLRYLTTLRRDAFAFFTMQTNGDVIWMEGDRDNTSQTITFKKQVRTGFSGNIPTYASATTLCTCTTSSTNPLYKAQTTLRLTDSGLLLIFCQDAVNTGFHFGAITVGVNNSFKWLTFHANAANHSYAGAYPTNGDFDIGNSMGVDNPYAGGDVAIAGSYGICNYHGEFWKSSQTNKEHLFNIEYGLCVGIFGKTTPEAELIDGVFSPREAAGNTFSTGMFYIGADLFFIGNDEGVHGGAQLWKMSNMSSVQIATTTVIV